MRALLPALALALAMITSPAHADEQLAAALESAGYFTGLDRAQAARLRADVVADGYAAVLRDRRLMAPVNTQSFAAGGVGAWLRHDIAPILASRGVTFRPAEDHLALDGSAYSVTIGAGEYPMWGAGETNTELASTVAAFAMVNSLLEAIGAPERLYLVGEGANGRAWLLSPAQAQIIRGVTPPDSWPYLPGLEALPAAVVTATPAVAPAAPPPTGSLTPSTAPSPLSLLTVAAPTGETPARALSSEALANQAPSEPH
jgi:hypothetical protein